MRRARYRTQGRLRRRSHSGRNGYSMHTTLVTVALISILLVLAGQALSTTLRTERRFEDGAALRGSILRMEHTLRRDLTEAKSVICDTARLAITRTSGESILWSVGDSRVLRSVQSQPPDGIEIAESSRSPEDQFFLGASVTAEFLTTPEQGIDLLIRPQIPDGPDDRYTGPPSVHISRKPIRMTFCTPPPVSSG